MEFMEPNFEKWLSFENANDKGPFLVLIKDIDWWDDNKLMIDDWFDRNCPNAKPDKHDTIIWFPNRSHYMMWRMAWDKI
jgi:hypothetical protein